MKAIKIAVYGRVQGVYYRANALNKAKEFSILGTVQNMPDGHVCIVAEGDERNLERFVEWCKKGPILANVTRVEIQDCPVYGHSSFEIIK